MAELRVAQVTTGRFHQFDLARQLARRGLLDAVVTGYPRWKLRNEGLPPGALRTFPWVHAPYMKLGGRLPAGWADRWLQASQIAIDRRAVRVLQPRPDVVIAMSGHGLEIGRQVQAAGGAWICVRGSTHVRVQAKILAQEHARLGLPWRAPSEASLRREEAEYAACDRIAVPSQVVWASFVAAGVSAAKLALVPYGVDLTRFHPDAPEAAPDDVFRVCSVGALSVRKGVAHVVEAFRRLDHPRKELVLIGAGAAGAGLGIGSWPTGVRRLGVQPQPEVRRWLARSQAFILGSVEEGMANVLGQALACGCPVVATAATGAADLFTDGVEGFIVARTDAALLAARLNDLAGDPALRRRMATAARRRVERLGGWNAYGDKMEALVRALAGRRVGR